jgi:hypothetical protein
MGKAFNQLCWSCEKCTNANACEWVKSYKLPAGATLDENSYITVCPNYMHDGITETRTTKQIAQDLGVSYVQYRAQQERKQAYTLFVRLHKIFGTLALAKMLGLKYTKILNFKNKTYNISKPIYKQLKLIAKE